MRMDVLNDFVWTDVVRFSENRFTEYRTVDLIAEKNFIQFIPAFPQFIRRKPVSFGPVSIPSQKGFNLK